MTRHHHRPPSPTMLSSRALPSVALVVVTLSLAAPSLFGVTAPAAAAPSTARPAAAPPVTAAEGADGPAVIGSRIIGRSVRDRPIRAFHLGQPRRAGSTVVAIAAMHGNERRSARPLRHLRDHRPVVGADLWVIPVLNPDGYARHDRQNARGVDLNRNFPVRWRDLDGETESGPGPASEPETRAAMRFLRRIDPDHVVSLHQPLFGVDPRTKNPAFARRLAREMRLPLHRIDCGGACHGTMTQWFNARRDGDSITAEFSQRPSARYLRSTAPNGLLRAIGGHR
ncbi:MAG: hypothetical protein K0Q93_1093 [Nocardioidaceae bacterium]|nr:hypothetical protein [Nocardioidaceae bacterium]